MNTIFAAHTADALNELSSWLHDLWFDADQVRWDSEIESVTVPCGPGEPARAWFVRVERSPSEFPLSVVFRRVKTIQMETKMGVAQIVAVRYDGEKQLVTIESTPGRLTMVVDAIDAALYGDRRLILRAF